MHQVFLVLRHLPVFRILLLLVALSRGFVYWLQLKKVERSSLGEQSRCLDRVTGEVDKYSTH